MKGRIAATIRPFIASQFRCLLPLSRCGAYIDSRRRRRRARSARASSAPVGRQLTALEPTDGHPAEPAGNTVPARLAAFGVEARTLPPLKKHLSRNEGYESHNFHHLGWRSRAGSLRRLLGSVTGGYLEARDALVGTPEFVPARRYPTLRASCQRIVRSAAFRVANRANNASGTAHTVASQLCLVPIASTCATTPSSRSVRG